MRRLAAVKFELDDGVRRLRVGRAKPLVLLVEDDPSTVMLLTSLIQLDVKVVSANSAAEAVDVYRRYAPDVVFLDIGLPDVDGLTLLENITRADSAAYVIMLTANAYLDNLERARRRGAKGFVAKPFNQGKIQTVLERALRERAK